MKSIWKFFASIRFTVILLLVIAVASIAGTIIPQNESVQVYLAKFGVTGYRILSTLDVFDMYSSWWFQALLLLLVINIVVCSLDRLPVTWRAVFSSRASRNPTMFRNLRRKETVETTLSLDVLKEECTKLVSGSDGVQQTPEGFYVIGEKGRWTRFGVYAVHLSIILLLVGALIGSMFGFDGYVKIVEGESISEVGLNDSTDPQKLDFQIRCDDFNISYYPTGSPKEYRSTLTIIEEGQPDIQKDILVNAPLRYRGINVFQSSYGRAPMLSFTSSETGREFTQTVMEKIYVDLPENLGFFLLEEYRHSMNYRGQDVGPVFIGRLIHPSGERETILLPVQHPTFDEMRKGSVIISVSDHVDRYYTGLQVTRDPGVWVVYLGFVLMIVGCYVTFFTSHQRLFVEAVRMEGGCRVMVAGFANKNKYGMQQEVKRIADRLRP